MERVLAVLRILGLMERGGGVAGPGAGHAQGKRFEGRGAFFLGLVHGRMRGEKPSAFPLDK